MITRLEVIDFKKIQAVAIDPEGQVLITGDNAQGKSSILDAIEMALTNQGSDHPIRMGAASAQIKLTIDGAEGVYEVKRKYTPKGQYLEVTAADGSKVPQAQTFLNALVGNMSFDPEAFTRLKPKEQAELLRKTAGLDTADLDEERKRIYAERTAVNRKKDEAETLLNSTPKADGGPREVVSVSELYTRRDDLQNAIDHIDNAFDKVQDTEHQATLIGTMLDEAKAKVAQLQKQYDDMTASLAALQKATDGMEAQQKEHLAELAKVNESIKGADAAAEEARNHNKLLELRKERNARWTELVKESNALTKRIEDIDSERAKRIADAKFPVDGMSVNEDGVFVNGVPFADLNTAERIKVSTYIAMALNPKLRVIFVREGALLNSSNLKLLCDIAEKEGYQLFIERFQETAGEHGIHIIDGSIAAIDGKEV